MPYQVGDKVRLLDLAKNRNHDRLHRWMDQDLTVMHVRDRDPFDGNGDQNIRLEEDPQHSLYNSGRFVLAAPVLQWAADPFDGIVAPPAPLFNAIGHNAIMNPAEQKWKYEIGEQVILLDGKDIKGGAVGWGGRMAEMAGQIGTIKSRHGLNDVGRLYYKIVENAYNWNEEWLESIVEEQAFQAGDVVTLTKDEDRRGEGLHFPEPMIEWADEGREFILDCKEGDWWRVVDDDGHDFVYKEEWFDMAKAKLKEGDLLWYIDHTLEANRGTFIKEENRPTYYLNKILDNGRFEVMVWQDDAIGVRIGTYEPELWMKKPRQKKAKAKPADPVIDPKVQAEKLEKLLVECNKTLAESAGGCANFYLITEDKKGKLNKIGGVHQPCHYELRGGYDGAGSPAVAVLDSIHRRRAALPEFKRQGFKDYVTYLLNRSPWADCYMAKDFDDAEKNGIRMNIDMTANQLVGACIAMRQSSEFSNILPVHAFLKSKRFSGDVCFLVGQYYSMDQHGKIFPIDTGSGHTILSSGMESGAVFKFFATKEFVGEDKKKSYRESKAYSNIFGSISGREEYARGKAGEVGIMKWMRNNCVAEETGAGLNKKMEVTEASLLKLARAVKAELLKHKQPVEA